MTVLDYQIADDADDGWEDNTWHGSSAHWWGTTGVFDENGGYRFPGVAVPQGATIDAAYLSFWGRNSPNSGIHMRMYGDDVDNAAAWSGSDKPSGITQTTAFVVVEPSTDGWAADQFNNSREAKAVIQEIVDRAGWVSGNAMRFAVINNASSAEQNHVSDYTNDSAQAAKLHIEYTEASGTTYTVTATVTGDSATPAAPLVVTRSVAATVADDSAVQIANLAVTRAMTAALSGTSAVQSANLVVLRLVSPRVTAADGISTPHLSVIWTFAATLTATGATGDDADLSTTGGLVSASITATSNASSPALPVVRAVAATITVQGVAPNDLVLITTAITFAMVRGPIYVLIPSAVVTTAAPSILVLED